MNLLLSFLMLTLMTCLSAPSFAASGGGPGEKFVKTIYVKFGGSATAGGSSYDAAKSCAADGDLWVIPAGVVVEGVYVIVDTAVTGSTDLDLGDDDDGDGFVDGSVGVTLGTPGMYSHNAKDAGAYLRKQTAGATDAADIDVVPNSKYYSASGKELKQDITTACTAGRYRVVIEGMYVGAK